MINSNEIKTFNIEQVINQVKNERKSYIQVKSLEYLFHLDFRDCQSLNENSLWELRGQRLEGRTVKRWEWWV